MVELLICYLFLNGICSSGLQFCGHRTDRNGERGSPQVDWRAQAEPKCSLTQVKTTTALA